MIDNTPNDLHQTVEWFSGLMERELLENIYKGGWDDCSLLWLQTKLSEKVGKLSGLLARFHWSRGGEIIGENSKAKSRAIEEAADIANFAMMIADILRADIENG